MIDQTKNSPRCSVCNKGTTMAYNRPHSLHRTKRIVLPNLQPDQKYGLICTGCKRTKNKNS